MPAPADLAARAQHVGGKLGLGDAQGGRQPLDDFQGGEDLTGLHVPEVAGLETGCPGQLLEAHPALFPQLKQATSDGVFFRHISMVSQRVLPRTYQE